MLRRSTRATRVYAPPEISLDSSSPDTRTPVSSDDEEEIDVDVVAAVPSSSSSSSSSADGVVGATPQAPVQHPRSGGPSKLFVPMKESDKRKTKLTDRERRRQSYLFHRDTAMRTGQCASLAGITEMFSVATRDYEKAKERMQDASREFLRTQAIFSGYRVAVMEKLGAMQDKAAFFLAANEKREVEEESMENTEDVAQNYAQGSSLTQYVCDHCGGAITEYHRAYACRNTTCYYIECERCLIDRALEPGSGWKKMLANCTKFSRVEEKDGGHCRWCNEKFHVDDMKRFVTSDTFVVRVLEAAEEAVVCDVCLCVPEGHVHMQQCESCQNYKACDRCVMKFQRGNTTLYIKCPACQQRWYK